jgi:hypothetical protein
VSACALSSHALDSRSPQVRCLRCRSKHSRQTAREQFKPVTPTNGFWALTCGNAVRALVSPAPRPRVGSRTSLPSLPGSMMPTGEHGPSPPRNWSRPASTGSLLLPGTGCGPSTSMRSRMATGHPDRRRWASPRQRRRSPPGSTSSATASATSTASRDPPPPRPLHECLRDRRLNGAHWAWESPKGLLDWMHAAMARTSRCPAEVAALRRAGAARLATTLSRFRDQLHTRGLGRARCVARGPVDHRRLGTHLEAIHTPGHTRGHLSIAMRARACSSPVTRAPSHHALDRLRAGARGLPLRDYLASLAV